jgi:3-hydroxyisobutyrate dehydrogenase
MTTETIGFIGLGTMGRHMAGHLARAGYEVIAYDIDRERTKSFAAEHGTKAPAALADLARASFILTMVPTGDVVREVITGGGNASLANMLPKGAIVVDTTSSVPDGTLELGAILAERGITLIDAPVSGGRVGAQDRNLVFMVGCGDDDAFARAETILKELGPHVFRLGPMAAGHVMKTLNNYISGAALIACAEALIVGRQYGLDPNVMTEVVNVSTGRSFASETSMRRMVNRDYSGTFTLRLFTKDLKIAADAADAKQVKAPLIHASYDRMNEALTAADAAPDIDHAHAFEFWEKEVG